MSINKKLESKLDNNNNNSNNLEDMVRNAQENIQKLKEITKQNEQTNKLINKNIRSISVPKKYNKQQQNENNLISSSSLHLNSNNNSNLNNNSNSNSSIDLNRKVDFLFKKTKEIDSSLNIIKSEFHGIKTTTKESQNLSLQLSDLIKMDKHSIVELREQIIGLKQKYERITQQEIIRGKFSENASNLAAITAPIDVGIISEQIFNRVHREFTKVVDEVVRACVSEQVEFMKKWNTTTTAANGEHEAEMKTQINSLKRRQVKFDEVLLELKGFF